MLPRLSGFTPFRSRPSRGGFPLSTGRTSTLYFYIKVRYTLLISQVANKSMNKNLPIEYQQEQETRWGGSKEWSSYKGEKLVKERIEELVPDANKISVKVGITRRWSKSQYMYFTRITVVWYDWASRGRYGSRAQRTIIASKGNESVDMKRVVAAIKEGIKEQEKASRIDNSRRVAENSSHKLAESLNEELNLSYSSKVRMSGASGSANAGNVVVKFEATVSPEKAREIAKILQSIA